MRNIFNGLRNNNNYKLDVKPIPNTNNYYQQKSAEVNLESEKNPPSLKKDLKETFFVLKEKFSGFLGNLKKNNNKIENNNSENYKSALKRLQTIFYELKNTDNNESKKQGCLIELNKIANKFPALRSIIFSIIASFSVVPANAHIPIKKINYTNSTAPMIDLSNVQVLLETAKDLEPKDNKVEFKIDSNNELLVQPNDNKEHPMKELLKFTGKKTQVYKITYSNGKTENITWANGNFYPVNANKGKNVKVGVDFTHPVLVKNYFYIEPIEPSHEIKKSIQNAIHINCEENCKITKAENKTQIEITDGSAKLTEMLPISNGSIIVTNIATGGKHILVPQENPEDYVVSKIIKAGNGKYEKQNKIIGGHYYITKEDELIVEKYNPAEKPEILIDNKTTKEEHVIKKYTTHLIQKGEGLWIIAKKHGTTVKELMKLNNLKTSVIRYGEKLKIPKLEPLKKIKTEFKKITQEKELVQPSFPVNLNTPHVEFIGFTENKVEFKLDNHKPCLHDIMPLSQYPENALATVKVFKRRRLVGEYIVEPNKKQRRWFITNVLKEDPSKPANGKGKTLRIYGNGHNYKVEIKNQLKEKVIQESDKLILKNYLGGNYEAEIKKIIKSHNLEPENISSIEVKKTGLFEITIEITDNDGKKHQINLAHKIKMDSEEMGYFDSFMEHLKNSKQSFEQKINNAVELLTSDEISDDDAESLMRNVIKISIEKNEQQNLSKLFTKKVAEFYPEIIEQFATEILLPLEDRDDYDMPEKTREHLGWQMRLLKAFLVYANYFSTEIASKIIEIFPSHAKVYINARNKKTEDYAFSVAGYRSRESMEVVLKNLEPSYKPKDNCYPTTSIISQYPKLVQYSTGEIEDASKVLSKKDQHTARETQRAEEIIEILRKLQIKQKLEEVLAEKLYNTPEAQYVQVLEKAHYKTINDNIDKVYPFLTAENYEQIFARFLLMLSKNLYDNGMKPAEKNIKKVINAMINAQEKANTISFKNKDVFIIEVGTSKPEDNVGLSEADKKMIKATGAKSVTTISGNSKEVLAEMENILDGSFIIFAMHGKQTGDGGGEISMIKNPIDNTEYITVEQINKVLASKKGLTIYDPTCYAPVGQSAEYEATMITDTLPSLIAIQEITPNGTTDDKFRAMAMAIDKAVEQILLGTGSETGTGAGSIAIPIKIGDLNLTITI